MVRLLLAQRQLRGVGSTPAIEHWPHAGPVPPQSRFALTTTAFVTSASCEMPVQPVSSSVAVKQRNRARSQVPTGQSELVAHVLPVPA